MADPTASTTSGIAKLDPDRDLDQPQSPRSAKRKQSPTSDIVAKRVRLSVDGSEDSPSTVRASPHTSPSGAEATNRAAADTTTERRVSSAQEEKKRGQRLFGGLINTLSQSTSSVQQKKRLEIEKRQQERARLQKAEDESRRAEILQKLKEERKREQVKFNEQSMRIRHSNMLAMAQSLCTKAEPKLYYKPWKLLPGQIECIDAQIAHAEAIIDREIYKFKEHHKTDLLPEQVSPGNPSGPTEGTVVSEHRVESSSHPSVNITESTNPSPLEQAPEPTSLYASNERDALEESGEVVVEGNEGMVIY